MSGHKFLSGLKGGIQVLSKRHALETLLIGRSPSIEKARSIILRLAHTRAAVLITGETGTGKEQVAKYLHTFGGWTGNFVALNCGGLPETLLESELFGHEPGAFTGATKRRIGKIEHAHKGTLFLDEIESMPCSQQVKLLRILQEQEVERLGSNTPIAVDCRVVAAAKGELGELCRRSRFREDLYYRLNVVPIELPPLRDRREDIPPLFRHFVLQAALRFGRDVPSISSTQIEKLLRHSWPGNVRELGNVASRFVLGLADHTESSGRSS